MYGQQNNMTKLIWDNDVGKSGSTRKLPNLKIYNCKNRSKLVLSSFMSQEVSDSPSVFLGLRFSRAGCKEATQSMGRNNKI